MTRLKLPSRLNFKSSSLRLIECSRIRTILDTLPATQRKEKSISKKILSIFPKFQHYPKIVRCSLFHRFKKKIPRIFQYFQSSFSKRNSKLRVTILLEKNSRRKSSRSKETVGTFDTAIQVTRQVRRNTSDKEGKRVQALSNLV